LQSPLIEGNVGSKPTCRPLPSDIGRIGPELVSLWRNSPYASRNRFRGHVVEACFKLYAVNIPSPTFFSGNMKNFTCETWRKFTRVCNINMCMGSLYRSTLLYYESHVLPKTQTLLHPFPWNPLMFPGSCFRVSITALHVFSVVLPFMLPKGRLFRWSARLTHHDADRRLQLPLPA